MTTKNNKRRLKLVDANAELRALEMSAPLPDLTVYDFLVVSSSAGKDSLAQLLYVTWLAEQQGVTDRIVVVHADLGRVEWQGTVELAREQAERLGHRFEVVSRIGGVSKGVSKSGTPLYAQGERYGDLLNQVQRRHRQLQAQGKDAAPWPSMANRWCTSDFKRGPCGTLFTELATDWRKLTGATRPCRILDCMGLRAQESRARAKKPAMVARTKTSRQHVTTWLPIKWWTEEQVWAVVRKSGLPYHKAYDLGMPRLSCAFCIFAGRDALMIAGEHNPELLDAYVKVERDTGYAFKQGLPLADIQDALAKGKRADKAANWDA